MARSGRAAERFVRLRRRDALAGRTASPCRSARLEGGGVAGGGSHRHRTVIGSDRTLASVPDWIVAVVDHRHPGVAHRRGPSLREPALSGRARARSDRDARERARRLDPVAAHGQHAASRSRPIGRSFNRRRDGSRGARSCSLSRSLLWADTSCGPASREAPDGESSGAPYSLSRTSSSKVPRPYPGGSYTVQSMGRWIDQLMGDGKARVIAAERVEPFFMDRDYSLADPSPQRSPNRCRVGPSRSLGETSPPANSGSAAPAHKHIRKGHRRSPACRRHRLTSSWVLDTLPEPLRSRKRRGHEHPRAVC